MTGTALQYRLTCGHTDWCNCAGCLNGYRHEPGTQWTCPVDGRTTVAPPLLTPEAARTTLQATVRYQLREAWERGMETAPHGIHSLADDGAPASLAAIMAAADDLATAIVTLWTARGGCPPPAGGQ